MNEKQFNEVMAKMDLIIRLLTLNIVKDMKTQTNKILFLSSLGFQPKEIAKLLGTTRNTVNVALSRSRKKARTAKGTGNPINQNSPNAETNEKSI